MCIFRQWALHLTFSNTFKSFKDFKNNFSNPSKQFYLISCCDIRLSMFFICPKFTSMFKTV